MRSIGSTAMRLSAIGVAAALVSTGCAGSSSGGSSSKPAQTSQSDVTKAMNTPTTVHFWSWLPNMQNEVNLFQAKYPKIKVVLTNQGGGAPQYTKLRAALKSGDVPDLAQIEYQYIPSFRADVQDLGAFGANDLKADFVTSVWGQVATGKVVHSLPQDIGPMGNLYRKDIFAKAGVQPPKTWDEFAVAAKTIKAKTGSYITNLASSDPGALIGLLWQNGAKLFTYDGEKTVGVNIDSPESEKVMSYWDKLIQAGDVSTDADFNDSWYQGLASGKYAGWLTAAWGPVYLAGAAPKTTGLWQATKLPQWSEGTDQSGSWGGSSYAVMKGAKHSIAAYQLAKFITSDPASSIMMATKQSEFPPLKSTLADTAFIDAKDPFFDGQQVNKLFSTIAPTVDQDFQWLPFMDFVYSSFNDTLGKALANKKDLVAGLKAWDESVSAYAKQQGFTVKE